jgi:hypothetical protein
MRDFFSAVEPGIQYSYFNIPCSVFSRPGGGIGRHAGLKILWPAMAVTVQLRSGALSDQKGRFFYAIFCLHNLFQKA